MQLLHNHDFDPAENIKVFLISEKTAMYSFCESGQSSLQLSFAEFFDMIDL